MRQHNVLSSWTAFSATQPAAATGGGSGSPRARPPGSRKPRPGRLADEPMEAFLPPTTPGAHCRRAFATRTRRPPAPQRQGGAPRVHSGCLVRKGSPLNNSLRHQA